MVNWLALVVGAPESNQVDKESQPKRVASKMPLDAEKYPFTEFPDLDAFDRAISEASKLRDCDRLDALSFAVTDFRADTYDDRGFRADLSARASRSANTIRRKTEP